MYTLGRTRIVLNRSLVKNNKNASKYILFPLTKTLHFIGAYFQIRIILIILL
jgi:hypothetical protein